MSGDESSVAGHDRDDIALDGEEAVLSVRDDLAAVILRDAHLALGEDREHRLVTALKEELCFVGAPAAISETS